MERFCLKTSGHLSQNPIRLVHWSCLALNVPWIHSYEFNIIQVNNWILKSLTFLQGRYNCRPNHACTLTFYATSMLASSSNVWLAESTQHGVALSWANRWSGAAGFFGIKRWSSNCKTKIFPGKMAGSVRISEGFWYSSYFQHLQYHENWNQTPSISHLGCFAQTNMFCDHCHISTCSSSPFKLRFCAASAMVSIFSGQKWQRNIHSWIDTIS